LGDQLDYFIIKARVFRLPLPNIPIFFFHYQNLRRGFLQAVRQFNYRVKRQEKEGI